MEESSEYDNLALQSDEIEALSAIYCDEWKAEDVEQRVYSMDIPSPQGSQCTVKLRVKLPPEYPTHSPPIYELSAPWMDRAEKSRLSFELEDLYCSHVGESVLYLWIEKVRDHLERHQRSHGGDSAVPNVPHESGESTDHRAPMPAKEALEDFVAGIPAVEESADQPIYHGEPFTEKRSTFQGHLAPVVTVEQVRDVMSRLKTNRKIASATHNIMAYRIYMEPNKSYIQDCDDDGETHAGSRLLHLLEILNVHNVLVVVSRWYGGILLGPNRFKHINNAARNVLEKCGYIDAKKTHDGPSTTRKKH